MQAPLQARSESEPPQSRVSERCIGAAVVAGARVDHHHGPLQQPAGRASEGHLGRGGLVRRAAAGVAALPAVPQLVGPRAVAALVDEPDGARGHVAGLAKPLPSDVGKNSTHTNTDKNTHTHVREMRRDKHSWCAKI